MQTYLNYYNKFHSNKCVFIKILCFSLFIKNCIKMHVEENFKKIAILFKVK